MKHFKKTISIIMVISTIITSTSAVTAAESDIIPENNISMWQPADLTVTSGDVTIEYKFNDENIAYYSHTTKNGIVFETEDNVDISAFDLRYDFVNNQKIELLGWTYNCGRSGYDGKNVYTYLADNDVSEEELKSYSEELSALNGIKYADTFTINAQNLGWLENSSKDNCCLYIQYRSDELSLNGLEEYCEKLNNDKELMSYLESIGANNKITVDKDKSLLCISGIADRTKIFDIQNKLNSFESINGNCTMIMNLFVSPVHSITFTNREILGDANGDNSINVSDCVFIAHNIAKGAELPDSADYNKDGKKNVLDASALAKDIARNLNKIIDISDKLSKFISENEIYAYESIDCYSVTLKVYIYDTTAVESIKEFMKENNISGSDVVFVDRSNLAEIAKKLSEFITENNFNAHACIEESIPEIVTVCIHDWRQEKEIVEPIKKFMKENNISEYDVNFLIYEADGEPVTSDANWYNSINVNDCIFIAQNIAKGAELPDSADYNKDGRKNVLDASALARDIAGNLTIE